MLKRRMILSLTALIGAAVVFIAATFAWFAVSNIIGGGLPTIDVLDIEAEATLEQKTWNEEISAWEWVPATEISLENLVPGDETNYRLLIENTGSVVIYSDVSFYGFLDSVASILGSPANFNAGKSLKDVLDLTVEIDEVITYDHQSILSMIGTLPPGISYPTASLFLASNLMIPVGQTKTVYFTITVSTDMGNDYENLKLTLLAIRVESALN